MHTKPITKVRIVEEIFNSVTHGIGAIIAIVGLIIGLATFRSSTAFILSFIIYSSCLILLMTMSSLYHALTFTRASGVFQILDHNGIYLLIAGTFTPFIVVLYGGWIRIVLLATVWLLVATGITLKVVLPIVMSRFEIGIYIALGWLGVIFFPKLGLIPSHAMWLVVAGGLFYTGGAILLAIKKPFVHVVWHMFVIVAACLQFVAITKLA